MKNRRAVELYLAYTSRRWAVTLVYWVIIFIFPVFIFLGFPTRYSA